MIQLQQCTDNHVAVPYDDIVNSYWHRCVRYGYNPPAGLPCLHPRRYQSNTATPHVMFHPGPVSSNLRTMYFPTGLIVYETGPYV